MGRFLECLINMSQARVQFDEKKFKEKEPINIRNDIDDILDQLRINGYAVVEDFYSQEKCQSLRAEVDRVHYIHKNDGYLWSDKYDADKRLFGAEVDSELIHAFYNDAYLTDVGENYFGSKLFNSNTLASRIEAKDNNVGSGQGWHRDSHHFQFKAIVYLSDVSIDNGPFQIIESSHRSGNALRNMKTMAIDTMTTRYTDEQIQKVIDEDPDKIKILTAKAGTLIFADTSALHTGMPIRSGERYTLFNYYYPNWMDKQHMRKYLNCI